MQHVRSQPRKDTSRRVCNSPYRIVWTPLHVGQLSHLAGTGSILGKSCDALFGVTFVPVPHVRRNNQTKVNNRVCGTLTNFSRAIFMAELLT